MFIEQIEKRLEHVVLQIEEQMINKSKNSGKYKENTYREVNEND